MMTGGERRLDIYLGGEIIATVTEEFDWQYTAAWKESGYAVSPHLPLRGDIPSVNVQRFLRNLLPEGNGLDELVRSFHVSQSNTFGLISALGLDTPGSLVILLAKKALPKKPSFRAITDDELVKRLDARDEFGLVMWDGKPRLSVAGVQDKINVFLNQKGQLGFGEGKLCSTHILKFEKQKLSHLVLNEFMTMQLARRCGLIVANVHLMRYGKHPALLIERFDRQVTLMHEVKRHHMIDACQALNLSPDHKYERHFGSGRDVAHIRDGASFQKLFNFANQCVSPAQTKQQILDWALFNVLIFNYDAHGKNISFFVGSQGLALTPFYDLVNIKMYPDFEHEMAMGLGDAFDGNRVNAYQLADFADTCGLSRSLLTQRLKILAKKLILAMDDELKQVLVHGEEQAYLKKYRLMILKRCEHLLKEADGIVSMAL